MQQNECRGIYPKLIIIPWLTLIQSSSGSEALLFLISQRRLTCT
jgi:hypothetical protein